MYVGMYVCRQTQTGSRAATQRQRDRQLKTESKPEKSEATRRVLLRCTVISLTTGRQNSCSNKQPATCHTMCVSLSLSLSLSNLSPADADARCAPESCLICRCHALEFNQRSRWGLVQAPARVIQSFSPSCSVLFVPLSLSLCSAAHDCYSVSRHKQRGAALARQGRSASVWSKRW